MTEFDSFVSTIAALRAPNGCPWDREQTHQSIAKNMLEEAYEAVDAIQANDMEHLREELGDVLLQVVLQCQIAADEGAFTIWDVCGDINEKMIRRHPHIFKDDRADSAEDVENLWQRVKDEEAASANGGEAPRKGLLDSIPAGFPALMQAQKVSKKAANVGFEWDSVAAVWEQVFEETQELSEAYEAAPVKANGKMSADVALEQGMTLDEAQQAIAEVEMEFGDVLFALVNVARRMGVDAETALLASTQKFRDRWGFIEQSTWARGREVEDLTTEDMNQLWAVAKTIEAERAARERGEI